MYWSANIKLDESERYGGRCEIAAKKANDERLKWFLLGSAAAMESLKFMEYGKDEESFLSYVTQSFEDNVRLEEMADE